MRLLFSAMIVMFGSLFVSAQDSELGNWMALVTNKKIDEKWNLHNSLQPRFYDLGSDLEQLLARVGLEYTARIVIKPN